MRRLTRHTVVAGAAALAVAAGGAAWWAAGPLVRMVQSGGLRGVHHTIAVDDDGTVTVDGDDHGRMPPSRLAQLRTLLAQSRFDTLPDRQLDQGVRDFYQYDVTYHRRTVVTNVPDRLPCLRPVIAFLADLA